MERIHPTVARRLLGASFAAGLLLAAAAATAAPVDGFPGVAQAYLVERDGLPIFAANAERRLPPASLTKVMTALLVVEAGELERVVTVSHRAARTPGASAGLIAGMQLTVHDLLAAMLLASANDACVALAEATARNEAAFTARMNERARMLGLANTNFTNACGFDSPSHRSSVADLARLAYEALNHAVFADLVGRTRHEIRSAEGKHLLRVASTNALLERVPGVRGVKTGYTRAAGHCLIAYAERGDRRALAVLLNARDRWWDAAAMLERALDHRAPVVIPKRAGG